jgi:hypothetical protein
MDQEVNSVYLSCRLLHLLFGVPRTIRFTTQSDLPPKYGCNGHRRHVLKPGRWTSVVQVLFDDGRPSSRFYLFIYLFSFVYLALVTTTAYANYCGPFLPNPPCQLSMWEETGVPGGNPRLSAER